MRDAVRLRRIQSAIFVVTALLAVVAAARVVHAWTGPQPTGSQVAAVVRQVPENSLAHKITCDGARSAWRCTVAGSGPTRSLDEVHVNRDRTVTIPAEDGLPERRFCCVPG